MTDLDAIRARHVPYVNAADYRRGECAHDGHPMPCDTAIVLAALDEVHQQASYWLMEHNAAIEREAQLRAALTFMPDVKFTNLPGLTAPDILIAIAAWMDKVDDESGSTNRDVQQHLRRWAAVMMDALATTPEGE